MSLEITAQVIKFFFEKKKKEEIAFKVPFWGKGGIFLFLCVAVGSRLAGCYRSFLGSLFRFRFFFS
mgnify:CR=1 FL=1